MSTQTPAPIYLKVAELEHQEYVKLRSSVTHHTLGLVDETGILFYDRSCHAQLKFEWSQVLELHRHLTQEQTQKEGEAS